MRAAPTTTSPDTIDMLMTLSFELLSPTMSMGEIAYLQTGPTFISLIEGLPRADDFVQAVVAECHVVQAVAIGIAVLQQAVHHDDALLYVGALLRPDEPTRVVELGRSSPPRSISCCSSSSSQR